MAFDKKYTNTLLSLFIISIWVGIIFLVAYPSRNAPTENFGVIMYFIFTLFLGLGIGIIALIIRLIKLIKLKTNFLYNLIGILNFCLGVYGSVISAQIETQWIILFGISFIIGLIIIIDIFSNINAQQRTNVQECDANEVK